MPASAVTCVAHKYVEAVAQAADCVPVTIPALGGELDIHALLARLDGIVATGSDPTGKARTLRGRVEPAEAGRTGSLPDATTLPLLRAAVALGVPVLAICRGHQELNVALGGSLHQFVHELPDKTDHREDTSLPEEERYGAAHTVDLAPGGFLANLFRAVSGCPSIRYIGRGSIGSAPRLVAEAWAEDGLIEGARVADAPAFAVSVQWHPEWRAAEDPYSKKLFEAFAQACRQRSTLHAPRSATA
ncbi:MAG: gamma-glutamyl-gamma-aminobutyrate hydrolase family protein [Arhodomonas sp.]|nr:gamma-glutamyl-gamma-aminobutyrate hydrolase family protein [Arhodomonas sp.]